MLGYVAKIKIKTLFYGILFYISYIILKKLFIPNQFPIILWWNAFVPEGDRLINCYNNQYSCISTKNRSYLNNEKIGAYMFYGSYLGNDFPLPRNKTPWAIFHEESPRNYAPILYKETQHIFNISSTFSRNSDFPITLQYLENISVLTDSKYFVPVQEKNKYLHKIAPVLYIQSNCDTPNNRDFYVSELKKYIPIDSYGKCLQNKKLPDKLKNIDPLDFYNEEILFFLSKYKFIIAIENANCEDYISEKLWKALIVGSIPIYLGSPTIKDWLPNKNSAILIKNFKNLKTLSEKIKLINKNDTLYNTFLEHKLSNKISNMLLKESLKRGPYGLEGQENDPTLAFECYVCKKIHEKFPDQRNQNLIYDCPKPYETNSWASFWDLGKCKSKALVKLLAKNEPFSETLLDSLWKKYYYENNCDF